MIQLLPLQQANLNDTYLMWWFVQGLGTQRETRGPEHQVSWGGTQIWFQTLATLGVTGMWWKRKFNPALHVGLLQHWWEKMSHFHGFRHEYRKTFPALCLKCLTDLLKACMEMNNFYSSLTFAYTACTCGYPAVPCLPLTATSTALHIT